MEFKSAQSTTPCAATAKAPWCAVATCSRAWARWPSCSTTTARCSFCQWAHHPRWQGAAPSPDRPPGAVQKRRRRVDGVGGLREDGSTASLGRTTAPTSSPARSTPAVSCPKPAVFRLGATTAINGKSYSVAYSGSAQLVSAQGELPQLPPLANRLTWWSCAAPMARCSASTTAIPRPAWSGGAWCCWKTQAAGPQRRIGQGRKKAGSSTARIAAHRCRCSCPPPRA